MAIAGDADEGSDERIEVGRFHVLAGDGDGEGGVLVEMEVIMRLDESLFAEGRFAVGLPGSAFVVGDVGQHGPAVFEVHLAAVDVRAGELDIHFLGLAVNLLDEERNGYFP